MEAWIYFTASVDDNSIGRFINLVISLLNNGFVKFNILLSTQGGYVHSGVNAFSFLKSLSAEVVMYNLGQVHSIGGTFFMAANKDKRFCLPHSCFLVHAVSLVVGSNGASYEEKLLEEKLGGIKNDTIRIARIMSECSDASLEVIEQMMRTGITADAQKAKGLGFVCNIISEIKIPEGAKTFSVTDAV